MTLCQLYTMLTKPVEVLFPCFSDVNFCLPIFSFSDCHSELPHILINPLFFSKVFGASSCVSPTSILNPDDLSILFLDFCCQIKKY